MTKQASEKSVKLTDEDVIQKRLATLSAKRQFVGASVSMGWQMAGAVLIPVIIGVKLDDHFHSSPSYTLAALVLACGGAIAIVSNTIKQVGRDQAAADSPKTKEKSSDN